MKIEEATQKKLAELKDLESELLFLLEREKFLRRKIGEVEGNIQVLNSIETIEGQEVEIKETT